MEMVEGQNQHKICPKRIKFKEIEDKGEVDRLSALPDCLLVDILSRLPFTKYVFSTCILSKRWKHLWTLIPTLIFRDRGSCFPRSEFYSFVDKALTQRPQSKLKRFQVNTGYHIQYESQVNSWIRYAISCNVEELILKLYTVSEAEYQLDQFVYISSCFTDLTLEGCILNPAGAISWKNLRSLSISNGKLDEDVIENILSGSPVLETLELDKCFGYKLLDITSRSVKNLVFSGYRDLDHYEWEFVEVIEINAPNISSLTIKGESSESSVSARKKEVEGQIHRKFRAKRMRFKKIEEKGEVDRVSALPDSLLVEILSRLPSTKNAFSTCIPFKRWKHVWTLIPILIFTDGDSHRPEFYSFVDKALAQRPQSKLKKLKVVATYNDKLELPFNNWIRYAISCNVEQLIFKLDWYWGTVYELDRIFYISSCFTDLTLEGCISNPNGAISWKNLRSLCITYGKLDEDLIENILSGSPLLETLVLDRCYGYRRLDITSKSVKNLVFCGYKDLDLDEWEFAEVIEINAPNISSLTIEYELCLWKLLLLNMTSLIEAKLNYANHYLMSENLEEEMLKGFIVNLCHVKELKIGRCCSKVLSRLVAKGFDIPSNVKLSDGDSSESESDEDN